MSSDGCHSGLINFSGLISCIFFGIGAYEKNAGNEAREMRPEVASLELSLTS